MGVFKKVVFKGCTWCRSPRFFAGLNSVCRVVEHTLLLWEEVGEVLFFMWDREGGLLLLDVGPLQWSL